MMGKVMGLLQRWRRKMVEAEEVIGCDMVVIWGKGESFEAVKGNRGI
jgi:hypothetical protein